MRYIQIEHNMNEQYVLICNSRLHLMDHNLTRDMDYYLFLI